LIESDPFAVVTGTMLRSNDLARRHAEHAATIEPAVLAVLRGGWYVLGQAVERFERAFADYCGVAHAIGVANGTDALELAVRALELERDDEVIATANAGMYAACAIVAAGAVPRFADVDARTMTLSPGALRAAITARTRAVIVTHLYGQAAAMDELLAVASEAGIAVIEDCAQAHGATHGGCRVGGIGTIAAFSFYPTKNLGAYGDGGAITTRDDALAARIRAQRQYGWTGKYHATVAGGRNSRLDELQAAILSAQLPHLDADNARRRAIAQRFSAEIRHNAITVPAIDDTHVAHLYVVRSAKRDALREHLAARQIAADVHYPIPDHRQPAMRAYVRDVALPISERLATEVLSLPCFPGMTDDEATHVIAACNGWRP
jgi:dTDP-3-amino-2,3,6-trideoxy-4-keto-D-glucose/dTDP-3-amino-3,4,6-trideoxy-alpha-D-glucose/dTDP-2,6-dideoxy-D-kanosamine transaminase